VARRPLEGTTVHVEGSTDTERWRNLLRLFGAKSEPCPPGTRPYPPVWLGYYTSVPLEVVTSYQVGWHSRPLPLLESLTIRGPKDVDDPDVIDLSHFPSLQDLYLEDVPPATYALQLRDLVQLESLRLHPNGPLHEWLNVVSTMTHLQSLKLHCHELPDTIRLLRHLPALEVTGTCGRPLHQWTGPPLCRTSRSRLQGSRG